MRLIVLYESVYGNTEAVARAVADGLAPVGEVTLARFAEVPRAAVEEADLVVLGRPTHAWGMTKPASRKQPGAEGYAVGAREWLEGSPRGAGKLAATFDTRFARPRWLTGSAALRIAREAPAEGVPPAGPAAELLRPPFRGAASGRRGGSGTEVGRGARRTGDDMKPQDYSRRTPRSRKAISAFVKRWLDEAGAVCPARAPAGC